MPPSQRSSYTGPVHVSLEHEVTMADGKKVHFIGATLARGVKAEDVDLSDDVLKRIWEKNKDRINDPRYAVNIADILDCPAYHMDEQRLQVCVPQPTQLPELAAMKKSLTPFERWQRLLRPYRDSAPVVEHH